MSDVALRQRGGGPARYSSSTRTRRRSHPLNRRTDRPRRSPGSRGYAPCLVEFGPLRAPIMSALRQSKSFRPLGAAAETGRSRERPWNPPMMIIVPSP
jgi:hypothetical protein